MTEKSMPKKQSGIERAFEGGLWYSRFIVILGVVFSLLGSILFFVIGSEDVIAVLKSYISGQYLSHADLLVTIIGAVDFYLIGIVLLILSFGMYELFISEIDQAEGKNRTILEIHSLDDLKTKLVNSIIIVLIVSFFQRIIAMAFTTPLDMLYFAISILALAAGVFFLRKLSSKSV